MLTDEGDSSKLSSDELEVLSALRRMVETKHIVSLNPDQTKIVLEMIDWFVQWRSLLRFATGVRNFALLLTGLLAIYWTSREALLEFIRSATQ